MNADPHLCATADCAISGCVDEWSRDALSGWAWNPAQPEKAVTVEVRLDGHPLTKVLANRLRPDVQHAGFGTGRYGFSVDLPDIGSIMSPHKLQVRVMGADAQLRGSPILLAPTMEFDTEAERSFTALLASPGSMAQLRKRLLFLTAQVDRMLDRIDDHATQRRKRAVADSCKWRWRPEDGAAPPPAPLRALVIDERLPSLGCDAGSNAILSHMRSLQRIGYDVSFVPSDVRESPVAEQLAQSGITVHVSPWTGSVEELLRRQAGQFDLVYMHRVSIVARYGNLVSTSMGGARRIYSVADLHHLRLLRQAKAEGPTPGALRHAAYIRRLELTAAAEAHAVITHSSHEATLLAAAVPRANIVVAPWDCEREPLPGDFSQRLNLAFIGNFQHPPNADAAVWLATEIMPLVWQTDHRIACLIVGAAPPRFLRELNDPRIRVLGAVPELDEVLSQVRLTVAPLLFGAGLKGKVVDSLAAGVPCVCSPIAAEGFAFQAPLDDLLGEDAAGIAARILAVHGNSETFERLRAAGIEHVRAHFSKARVDDRLRLAAGLPVHVFA
jgi:glycosyltransferase involved in cell wall biosynthesis